MDFINKIDNTTKDITGITLIVPYIYISDWESSNNGKILRENNIRAILTIDDEPKSKRTLQLYLEEEIDFFQVKLDDDEKVEIKNHFEITYNFINKFVERKENILVHCQMGISRSPTIVIHYLLRNMYETGIKEKIENVKESSDDLLYKAISVVKGSRKCISPNMGFLNQLFEISKEYKSKFISENTG